MDSESETVIEQAALAWFVLLRDEDASVEDWSRFRAWRDASPDHARAFAELERLWAGLDQAQPQRADREVAVGAAPLRDRSAAVARPSRYRPVAIAASFAALVVMSTQLVPANLFADYRSAIGARETIVLADGSQVELGPASAIDVDFDASDRRITLLAGEAFFTVEKDPSRPFHVQAGDGDVAVLGTEFNVKVDEDVTVAVAHNTVAVSAGPDTVRVSQGLMVRYGRGGVSSPQVADLETVQAWRHDRLVFRDVPLSKVVAELGRYRRGRIQILDEAAGNARVTAVFDAGRIDAALDTIAESFGFRIFRATGLLTVVTSR